MSGSLSVRSKLPKYAVLDHVILETYLRVIGIAPFALWCCLRKFADFETGVCYPKISTLAEMMAVSRRTVERSIPILIENNFLECESGAETGKANHYIITVPYDNMTQGVRLNDAGVRQVDAGGATQVSQGNKEELKPSNTNHSTEEQTLFTGEVVEPANKIVKKFTIPTVQEIGTYCFSRNNGVDPQEFWDHYQSKGWVVGKSPMKDWQAAVRNWERRNGAFHGQQLNRAEQRQQRNRQIITDELSRPRY